METARTFDIFLATAPGLEPVLAEEVRALGLGAAGCEPGGVSLRGNHETVMRANLWLRCANRVLVRIGHFRAAHLSQLDKRARKLDFAALIPPGTPVAVEAVCRRSKIYHSGAAAERVERALREAAGALPENGDPLRVLVRIERDMCSVSLDTSGALLHRRGFKQAVAKAPLRETLAAAFLWQCGFRGSEPVLDPMCGSGTFPIEAAEIAAGLAPGRERHFAFERLNGFALEKRVELRTGSARTETSHRFHGSDRDAGAIRAAIANAERAGVAEVITFAERALGDIQPPEGPPGLVMANPPYGTRIGDAKRLRPLYASLGAVLRERFAGWRVGLVTSEPALAKATALPFTAPLPPVPHGALRVRLYRTDPLG